jgi:hypothetical protein
VALELGERTDIHWCLAMMAESERSGNDEDVDDEFCTEHDEDTNEQLDLMNKLRKT